MRTCSIMDVIRGGACSVLGYGVSNRPLVDFLVKLGVSVEVRDKKQPEADAVAKLRAQNIPLITGEGYLSDIHADLIFRSPGIRPDHAGIQAAVSEGAELLSEMELFFALCSATTLCQRKV